MRRWPIGACKRNACGIAVPRQHVEDGCHVSFECGNVLDCQREYSRADVRELEGRLQPHYVTPRRCVEIGMIDNKARALSRPGQGMTGRVYALQAVRPVRSGNAERRREAR